MTTAAERKLIERNEENGQFYVETHNHLTDCTTRSRIGFRKLEDAKALLDILFRHRVVAEITNIGGATVDRNSPNPYALSKEDSSKAWDLWKEGTDEEIQALMKRHKY